MKSSTNLFENFENQVSLKGKWSAENSGGSLLEKSFTKNCFYILDIKSLDSQMIIEITTTSNLRVGLYIISTSKKSLNEVNQEDLDLALSTSEFSLKNNSLFYDFGKKIGTFLVVPCNFNKSEGTFDLKISSTKPIGITEGLSKDYLIRKDYFIHPVYDNQYQSASSKKPISM